MYQTIKTFVDDIANWLESLGFLLAMFTAIKVFILDDRLITFNKRHLFQVRSQEHISDLKEISKKISGLISDFSSNKTELKMQLKKSEEVAKSIKKKLMKKDMENTISLIKEAKKIEKLPESIEKLNFIKKTYFKAVKREEFNESVMNNYYVKLSGLITSLEELNKDNAKTLML